MEQLKKLGFKGQMIVMVVVMAIVAGVGFKYFPNIEKIKKDIESKTVVLNDLNAEIDRGRALREKLPALEREIKGLEAQLEQLKQIMPPDRIDSQIVSQTETLAGRSRLDILTLSPGRHVKKEFYNEYPITFNVKANYHDLGLFFARLAELQRIFNVQQITMKQELSPQSSIAANFKAVTYIYREGEAVKPDAGGKGRRRGKKGR
jgi:type IV pilus assembly protein PilO